MKKFIFFLIIMLCPISLFPQTENIKIMTYNIRCGYCEDSSSVNNWSNRKYLVAYVIKGHNPDLIGLQEAEMFQVKELIEMLGNYDWYGVSRDDGKEGGESTAILYRKKRFELEEKQTLWLSETPEFVSKGWDAAFKRTFTIAKLKDIISSKEFYYFNTHLDHIGEIARTESSKLMLNKINEYSNDYPVILSGDFNFTSISDGYKIITSQLSDSKFISRTGSIGGNITFNGFGKDVLPDNKIDFIFLNDKVEVLNTIIDTATFNGLYPSDHYPVISEVKLLP